MPVQRSDDPEATARGLARLIAADDARDWPVPATATLTPTQNPGLHARFAHWEQLMDEKL